MMPWNRQLFPGSYRDLAEKGAVYEYRIVNQSISENLPQVVYTTTEKAHVLENQQLVVHGTIVNGQALNRYTWRKKLDVVSVLEIDSFIAILAAMIYAVLEQWKGKRNNEVGEIQNKDRDRRGRYYYQYPV